jgi:hypothetical protein
MIRRKKVLSSVVILAFVLVFALALIVDANASPILDNSTGTPVYKSSYSGLNGQTFSSPAKVTLAENRYDGTVNTTEIGGGNYNGTGFFNDRIKQTPLIGIFFADSFTNISAVTELTKFLFLILVVVLIYSALAYVKFPDNAALRMLLSVVVGFLSVFMISSSELLAILESYKALGLSLTIFLPIFILAFFTFVVATEAKPFGILAQKILWVIYSGYLFLKTGSLILIKFLARSSGSVESPAMQGFFRFILGANWRQSLALQSSTLTLIILFVVSIFVWITFVSSNKALRHWLAHEKMAADMDVYEDNATRQQKARKVDAGLTRDQ